MKRKLYATVVLLLAAVASVFLLGTHTSAISTSSSHHDGGMNHFASVPCVTICSAVTPNDDDVLVDVTDNDEDTSGDSVVAYTSLTPLSFEVIHSQEARTAVKFEPPPGTPAYIELAVYRS